MTRPEGIRDPDDSSDADDPRSRYVSRPTDTLAWLWAAVQVLAPILGLLIAAVLIGYGLVYLGFLR